MKETQPTDVAEATFAHDLIGHCLDEMKAMPDVWQKMSKTQQEEVIYRLDKRVKAITINAIETIASFGLTRVVVDVGNITIKDLVLEAKITTGKGSEHTHDFCDIQGQRAILVVSDAQELPKQSHKHQGEKDQRALELGDPGVISEGEPVESEPVDTEPAGKSWRVSFEGSDRDGQVGIGLGYYRDEAAEKDVYTLQFEDGAEENFYVHCLFPSEPAARKPPTPEPVPQDQQPVDVAGPAQPADPVEEDEEPTIPLDGLAVDKAHCERVVAELVGKSAYDPEQALQLVTEAAGPAAHEAIRELEEVVVDDTEELLAPFFKAAGIDRAMDLGQLE